MWRVASSNALIRCKSHHRSTDLVFAARLVNLSTEPRAEQKVDSNRGGQAQGDQANVNQANGNQSNGNQANGNQANGNQANGNQANGGGNGQGPPNDNRYKYMAVFGSCVAGFGFGAMLCNDKSRFWIVEHIPLTKAVLSRLGCCVERPIEVKEPSPCDLEQVKIILRKPKVEALPQKDGASIIHVADKTVSGMSLNQALANDHIKHEEKVKQALEKHCNASAGETNKQTLAAAECAAKTLFPEEEEREPDGVILKAGTSSARMMLANFQPLTKTQLEERNRKAHEKQQQKMKERERKDEAYLNLQKDKEERQAAQELEKERRLAAEEQQLAASVLAKIKKNQAFENTACTKISQVLEKALQAMNVNDIAIHTCREHSTKLKEAMDASTEEEALKIWPTVHALNKVRGEQVDEAHRVQKEAEDLIVDYLKLLDDAKKDADIKDNPNIAVYRKQIQQTAFEVKSMHDKLRSQENVSSIMKHYYHIMKRDKADFLRELEAIVPNGIKLGKQGLNLSMDELNALLAHSHRRIFQLKRQLMEQQLLEHQRLEDALCAQKKADMKEANVKLGQELDKQYEQMQVEKDDAILAHDKKFETERELSRQTHANEHHDHLQDMLALQQKKLMEQFDVALRERLIHERHVFIDLISKNMAKVKGLEAALEERADLQKVIVHVQDVMSSALCLMHAVAHDVDCVGDEYTLIRIDEPLKRCFQAADAHPFVEAILHSIPSRAVENGIYSMSSLEKRFEVVYKECSKVALRSVGDNDDSLWTRMWARLTNSVSSTPKAKYLLASEFENGEGMSQADLVVQAKYFMDKRCYAEAVRCMVQLEGICRELSQEWIEEARLVLSVRQAAEVLVAYANSRGMGTIF